MHDVATLADLPFARTRAVIINCGTKWVTSLALASMLANTDCPVLVIDCESRDGSRRHFEALSRNHALQFDWLEWPLRPHPAALDALFSAIKSDFVLLVDSDIEVRSSRLVDAMAAALLGSADTYGAGFVHGPVWMGAEHGLPPWTGYYAERMWIPFVLLRTQAIRRALAQGLSFANRRPFLEIANRPVLSRLIGYRYRIRGLRHVRVPASWHRKDAKQVQIGGRVPAFIEYDTGADMHKNLLEQGYLFGRLPEALWGDVRHYHGVTRSSLTSQFRRAAIRLRMTSIDAGPEQTPMLLDIKSRLSEVYGIHSVDA